MTFLLVLVFNSLMYIALAGARLTFSLFALQKLGASDFDVGLIMALFGLVAVPLAVPLGRMLDRTGVRLPMTAGVALAATGIFCAWWMPAVSMLYASSVLMGTGWLAIHVSLLKIVGDLSDPERRLASYNAYSLSFGFAILIGPPSAGFMIDQLGHRATLLVLLAIIGLAFAILLHAFRSLPRKSAPQAVRAGGSAFSLLMHARLRPVYIVGSLIGSAWELYTFVVPIHGHHLGLSASQIGLILGAYSAATFVIRVGMPAIARRYREWSIIRGALFASAIGFLLLPLVQGSATYVVLSFFMGLALGSCLPNTLSLLHSEAPAGRDGEALGIRVSITNVIQVTVPTLVGALGAAVGLTPVFWLFAAAMGGGCRTAHLRAIASSD